jgi:hypothetical protein
MAQQLGVVIASRELRRSGRTGQPVVVLFGKPRRDSRKDWACPFQIKGLGDSEVYKAFGVDAVSALTNALEGVRVALEKSGERLSWIGGEKGDSGFPRFVPMFFGLEFAERLGKMIDEQLEHLARSAIGGHKRRKRGG